jgi:hypothetical protein
MKTDPNTIRGILDQARNGAMEMIECAADILREADSLNLPCSFKRLVTDSCNDLADAKHELIDEMLRIEEQMAWSDTVQGIDASAIRPVTLAAIGKLNELTQEAREAEKRGELNKGFLLVLEEAALNLKESCSFLNLLPATSAPDGKSQATANEMSGISSLLRSLLASERNTATHEHLLDIHEVSAKHMRDVRTSIVFGDDGSVILREIDDEYRYAEEDYYNPSYSITLHVVEPPSADAFLRHFLAPLPADGTEMHLALVDALKEALKRTSCHALIDSVGCPYRRLSYSIRTS